MSESTFTVLVVDDNRSSATAMAKLLGQVGYAATAVFDGQSAIESLREKRYGAVLTDLKMAPVDGFEVLKVARSLKPPVNVIVFSAHGDVSVAVEAMRQGATDFLTKPVTVEQLAVRLRQLDGDRSTARDLAGDFLNLMPSSKRLYPVLEALAEVQSAVWFEGEVGVGRIEHARMLHHLDDSPGELHVLGPTDTLQWPEQGTVLFPSVDEWDVESQRDLVRSLLKVPEGLRLMATARPDSLARLEKGTLLSEVYYRLATMRVDVPPLREHPDDIVPLFMRVLEGRAQLYGRKVPDLSERQLEPLRAYDWPGNLRELVNMAERLLVLGFDSLQLANLKSKARSSTILGPGFSLANHLEHVEKTLLERALEKTNGDRREVGRLLGVERNSLRYKLKKYGLL